MSDINPHVGESEFRLSICIPTYNFGQFIGETLASLCVAIGTRTDVEVVILDSGSIDDTSLVVETFMPQLPTLTYVRTTSPQGIDRDMAHVLGLARGEYCWLFSADDTMSERAVESVLREIAQAHDLYLCCHADADLAMRVERPLYPVLSQGSAVEFELNSERDARDYFARALTTEAFFSFLGGIIIRRQRWNSVPLDEAFIGSCWAHVARILTLVRSGLHVKYLPIALLVKRGGNDSFATHGVVRRYGLAIDGYLRIARTFWGDADYRTAAVRRVLRNEFSVRHFLFAKWRCGQDPGLESIDHLESLFGALYGGRGIRLRLSAAMFRWTPTTAYMALKGCRVRFRNMLGSTFANAVGQRTR